MPEPQQQTIQGLPPGAVVKPISGSVDGLPPGAIVRPLEQSDNEPSFLESVGSEAKGFLQSAAESTPVGAAVKGYKEGGIPMAVGRSLESVYDPMGTVRGTLSRIPLVGRAARDVSKIPSEIISNPKNAAVPLSKATLHTAEALSPITGTGEMAANLEDKPLKEAIARGLVDIGVLSGGELFRAFKGGAVSTEQLHPSQHVDIIGRVLNEGLSQADNSMREEVSNHAQHFTDTVDDQSRNPIGVVNADKVVGALKDAWNTYVSTYTRGLGTKPPAVFQNVVKEALTSPRWTAKQATQVRSSLGEMAEAGDPKIRAISKQVSDQITPQLKAAASKAGVLKDFETYNDLHQKRMRIHDEVLDKVRGVESGESVLNSLRGKQGYLRNTVLPSLEKYGLDTKAFKEGLDVTDPKSSPKKLQGWLTRFGTGVALQALSGGTIPYRGGMLIGGAGAGAIDAARAAKAQARIAGNPAFQGGKQIVEKSIAPGKIPLSEPTPITPKETPTEAAVRQKGQELYRGANRPAIITPPPKEGGLLPELPAIRTSSAMAEAPKAAPEAVPQPADPYAKTQARLAYTRILNKAITSLTRGSKRALSAQEIKWIENQTNLDLSESSNVPKARQALVDLRKELNKGTPPVPKVRKQ